MAARLILGPLLRYVGSETATVWVETDAPAEVDVLGRRARTFHVSGHHYALVVVDELQPGAVTPYEVLVDGSIAWPLPDGRPPSAIHTRHNERQSLLIFGSCRVGAPERAPYTSSPADDPAGLGVDALWAFSRELQADPSRWPDGLILLGDQVYADEVPPETAAFIQARRDIAKPPGTEIADFEEYTHLYRESWSDPDIRWLLSTVPTTMIFDDHDVNDDWNISQSWVEEMRALPWWEARITGAFMSYWLYQHLGNLSPPELAEDELFHLVQGDSDAGPRLRSFAQALRPRIGRKPLGVLPRLRPNTPPRDRLPGGSSPRRGATRDDRRRGVGLDRRAQSRLVRPPNRGQHAAGIHVPRAPPPRVMERGSVQRRLGTHGGTHRRTAQTRRRPGALARVPRLLRAVRGALTDYQSRFRWEATRNDHGPRRRRPHRVRGRGGARQRRRTEPRATRSSARHFGIHSPRRNGASSASPARASPARCSRVSRALAGSLRQRQPGRSSTGRRSTTQSANSSSTSGQHT